MGHPIVLHLPGSVFGALIDHSGEGFYGPKTEAILSGLVRHWIATSKPAPRPWLDEDDADAPDDTRAGGATDSATAPAAPGADSATDAAITASAASIASTASTASAPATSRGYQWKQIFLPNGTELRAIHGGRSSYAQVEDEQIISDGVPSTPSRLANAQGCGTRSAWQAIWLRFPGGTHWRRAAECRQ